MEYEEMVTGTEIRTNYIYNIIINVSVTELFWLYYFHSKSPFLSIKYKCNFVYLIWLYL